MDLSIVSILMLDGITNGAIYALLALALLAMLTLGTGWLADGYSAREFTLTERLMFLLFAFLFVLLLLMVTRTVGRIAFGRNAARAITPPSAPPGSGPPRIPRGGR